jgi:peptidoglycan/LPS O-acetylase OafA/YrhL
MSPYLWKSLQRILTPGHNESSSGSSTGLTEPQEPLLRPVMPELDSVRGLAILAVLFYHGFYWQADFSLYSPVQRLFILATWTGRLGVNLFFVLSGFLITGLLLDSRERPNYYRRFYVRRALRILPAYALIIVVLWVTRYTTPAFLLLSVAYLSNLTPLFGVAIGYSVLWSLAVEEHFYFLWPTAVRIVSRRSLVWIAAAIVALSPLLRLLSFYLTRRDGFVSFQSYDYTWNSADGLACGVILSILLHDFVHDRKRVFNFSCLLLSLSAAIWAVGLPFGIFSRQRPLGASLQVVPWHFAFTAILSLVLLVGTSRFAAWVRLRPLRFFGEISYGLYLVHLLIFDAYDWFIRRFAWRPALSSGPFFARTVRFLCVAVVATLLATISRRYFEERFLRLKNRLS